MATARVCYLLALLLIFQSVHGASAFSSSSRKELRNREEGDEDYRRRSSEHHHHKSSDDHHEEEDEDEDDDRPYDRKHKKDDDDEDDDESKRSSSSSPFILREPVDIVQTEAGKIQVLPGLNDKGGALALNNIGLNFITMEPKALLLPQYVDAPCVLYVYKGKMRLGWVDNGLKQRDLEAGDIYVIPGGLVFYILNTDEAQRLRVFGMFDTSESLEMGRFQSSFVAGGVDPQTILSGFDSEVLAASFKVSPEEASEMLGNQNDGPIIYTSKSGFEKLNAKLDDSSSAWSWMNLFPSYYTQLLKDFDSSSNKRKRSVDSPVKPFNLLKKKSDFKNENGRTIAVDGDEYDPLRTADVGVFAVSLEPAAILAPHWNPRAAEVAFVTKGRGVIQISFPNGTSALNKRVDEGTVFFVPRYFPMCQIASRDGPFEFVGFSTSATPNNPQFLAGASSVLKDLDDETVSTAFAVPVDRMKEFIDHQKDAVILAGFVEEDNATRVV